MAQPLPASTNFVQVISNRLHNNLVIKASHKKVLPTTTSTQSNRKIHPVRDVDIFNALQLKSGSLLSRPKQASDLPTVLAEANTLDDAIIVEGTNKEKCILSTYKEPFGQDFDHSIVSEKKYVPGADSLLFLPDSARVNFADMGHRVDQEMANSQRGTDLEREATRQSHYIEWTRIMGIPDPLGPHEGHQLFERKNTL